MVRIIPLIFDSVCQNIYFSAIESTGHISFLFDRNFLIFHPLDSADKCTQVRFEVSCMILGLYFRVKGLESS